MKDLPELITAPVYNQPSQLSRYQKFWMKHIHDKRDLPFVQLLTIIHVTIIPVAVLLYTPVLQGRWWWIAALIYFYFSQFYFKSSFGLRLHCILHRKFIKTQTFFCNKYIFRCVCRFFGHLGDSYH